MQTKIKSTQRFGRALMLLAALTLTGGCGHRSDAPVSTAPSIANIQNNPNLAPEQKQNIVNTMHMHQNGGHIRGQIMQRETAGH